MDMVYGCTCAYTHMYYGYMYVLCIYRFVNRYTHTQNGILLTYCFLTYFYNLMFCYYCNFAPNILLQYNLVIALVRSIK